VELYNSGTNTVNLNGWFLTDSFTNLTRWAFPADTAINPGEYLIVWLDGQPNQTTASAPHTTFRIPTGTGSLALVFPFNSQATVLDYVNYAALPADRSYGLYPDGNASPRQIFYFTTPGGTNNHAAPALPLLINEWMAANTATLADPADGHFDDWFEIFNPNSVAVDLSGYTLTDNLTNATARWPIPAGTRIAARGFLLVWADNDTNQNTNSTDLHANFKLDKTGDTIGLFAPNGSLVDSVTFAEQTNDVSQGRWPDGAGNTFFMPTPTPRAANVIPNTPPPEVQVLSTTVNGDGDIVISWSAENARTYRVQYKDDLNASSWSHLSDVTASSPVASTTEVIGAGSQRFYRIQLINP